MTDQLEAAVARQCVERALAEKRHPNPLMRLLHYTPAEQQAFYLTFRLHLSDYFEKWQGFDLFKFEEALGVPHGTSMRDFILERYGDPAVSLILKLLGTKGGA